MPQTLPLVRVLLPAAAALILLRCGISLLAGRTLREVWGHLALAGGRKADLVSWENIIGRGRASDVVLRQSSVSRTHAALTRDDAGGWTVYDVHSRAGVSVNGKSITGPTAVKNGDTLSFGPVKAVFTKASAAEERAQAKERPRPGRRVRPTVTLLLLTLYIAALALPLWEQLGAAAILSFGCLLLTLWLSYAVTRALGRTGFEVETLAFFLSATGLAVSAGSEVMLLKQTLCLVLGVLLFWLLGWFLRDLGRVRKLRMPIAGAGLLLLAVNLIASEAVLGAKNWLTLGGVSFQPSELVKICFLFAGSTTLDKLFTRRSLLLFVGFAAASVGCLALMNDFGTALVFFTAYLVIAFLRSGSFATVLLSLAGTGYAAFLAVSMRPYIGRRFATWGRAWEFYNDGGYQQTRTMAACASGGLLGRGAGRGWLRSVFAADTDMVFGVVSEELGLLLAFMAVAAVLVLAAFAVKSTAGARSSFYAIAACGAATVLLTQVILNVFGSLDMVPFTGVTFPFLSRGGTSLLASWGLLAFLKAADTRQNGSQFVTRSQSAARSS